jgi:hypothetical protein
MVEVKLIDMPFGVAPLENGGKQIVVRHEASDTTYALPLDETAIERLIHQLGLTNEELRTLIQRQTESS